MKFFLLLLSILSASALEHFVLPSINKDRFIKEHSACLTSSKVDITIALQILYGVLEDDPNLKEFLYCMNRMNGLQDQNGLFIKRTLQQRIRNHLMSSHAIDAIIQDCAKDRETPQESAYQFLKCMRAVSMQP